MLEIHKRSNYPPLFVHRRLHQIPHVQPVCIELPDTQGTRDDYPTRPPRTQSKDASLGKPSHDYPSEPYVLASCRLSYPLLSTEYLLVL